MWFNYDAKTCTITAKHLDEEEFVGSHRNSGCQK
jgi:hypothetical protein